MKKEYYINEKNSLINKNKTNIGNNVSKIQLKKENNTIKIRNKNKKILKAYFKEQQTIKKRIYLYIILFIIILFPILFFVYKIYSKKRIEIMNNIELDKLSFNLTIEKEMNEEINEAQNYMNLILKGIKIDKDEKYYPSKNPKISIVISVYNGEAFLNTALLSIQNQDLKDIEIVMVDDGSKDNSVNLIKELMKTEPRIVLYENKENKGPFYTKAKGVLLSKGKYILVMDEDDMYVQRDAFRCLYVESERNNLDILGFYTRHSGASIGRYRNTFGEKKKIMYQPEVSNLMFYYDSNGSIKRFGGLLSNILVKANLFKKVIKLVDEKNLNTFMFCHEDFILFFLLSRYAYNAKYIDRVFYIFLHTWNPNDPKIVLRNQYKVDDIKNKQCLSYINFFEIIFKNTNNTTKDKKIAFSQLETYYLYNHCRVNKDTRDKAIEVFKLYLNCEYISKKDKDKIQKFIDEGNKI